MNRKILLVVNEEKRRKELSKILNEGGYEVSCNSFVENLLELVKSFDPALLLVDGNYIDSFGTKLRQNFPDKPVIAWMSQRDAHLAVGFIAINALECLSPPAEYFEVLEVVRHVLNETVAKDEPIPIPTKNYAPIIWKTFAVLSAACVVAIYALIVHNESSKSKTFVLTYQNPTGIYWTKKDLWASDWYTQSIYQYKIGGTLKLLKIYSFPEFNPNAIAVNNELLWITGTDGFIRTYTISNNVPTIVNKFKAPGYSPTGLCFQDKFLWSTDAETNKIYQHDIADPEHIIATFDYPGQMPVGFYWDGKQFWSADGKTNKVYRHAGPEQRFTVAATFALAPEGGGMVSGMAGDRKNLWLIYTSQPARVLRYPMSKLQQ